MTFTAEKKSQKKLYYLRQVQEELKKVSWTSKKELIFSTKVVIASTIFCGIGIYSADLIIHIFLKIFGNIMRILFG